MEWIIGILAAFLILLLLKLVGILRQIRDICRQLTFLKDYDSNLMITGQEASGPLRELMDELNEMLDRQREQRRRYLKKEQDISDAYTNLSHDILLKRLFPAIGGKRGSEGTSEIFKCH